MRLSVALFALLLIACKPTPQPAPLPIGDSAPVTCESVAAHVASLESGTCSDANGIPYAQPTRNGETFATTLCGAVDAGAHVPLACLASALSCDDVKACK